MTLPKFKHDDMPQDNTEPQNLGGGDSFDEPPRHVPKALKWAAGTAVGLVLLAGAGGLIATQLIDQQKYKSMIVAKVEEATGYTVDWDGNISLGMMPLPHASVSKLKVKAGDTEILSIAKADIQVALAPLLSKRIEVKNITIDEPVVTLLTTKSGVQTWVAKPKSAAATESNSDASASSDAAMDVVINSIEMNGGTIIIDNQQTKSRQELKNLNLDVRADSLKGPFDVTGDTEWSGQKIEIKATSGEINASEGSYPIQTSVAVPSAGINVSFSGVVDAKNMGANGDINLDVDDVATAVKGITGSAPSLPEGIGGKASVAGKLVYNSSRVAVDDMALAFGKLAYSGRVAADGLGENSTPQLSFQLEPTAKADANAPQVVQLLSGLTITAKGAIENEKIQITTANLKTMGNDISINGYSSMGASPKVDLTINAREINLDALTKTAGGAVSNDAKAAPAKMSADNMGFVVPFAGRVRANVGKLTTGGKTYSGIEADVTSNAGALTIANAAVSLPQDTSLSVSGKIADTSKLTGLDLKVSAKTQDAEKLMASFDVTPPELPKKLGAASLNGKFIGDLEKLGFTATVSALQFNIKGEGSVGDPLGTPAINSLKFNINHPNFNEALKTIQPGFAGSSGFYGALDVAGQLAWGDNKFDVSNINGKLGQTTIAGNVSATTQPRTKISGALDFGAIVLPSASNNGGSVAASNPAASSAKGDRWSRDTIDTAWMRGVDADLAIKAKSITQNLWKLSDANLAFKLNDGILTLDDVSAGLFGGRASINGTIRSGVGEKDPLTITTKMNADNVNAQQLMSAITGKPSYVLTGTLSKVDVSVNATGSSAATLIQTLDGTGVASGNDIIVTGVDIVALSNAAGGSFKPLERIGALSKSMGGSNQTKFDTFESDFAIEDGVVNLRKALFDSTDATMSTTGTVNLPAWTLNLNNKLTLKSNEADPINFTISGSLDNPAQSGLQGILMNRVDKLINKEGTTLNKALGKFLGTNKKAADVPIVAPVETPVEMAPVDAAPVDAAPATPSDAVAPAPEAKQPTEKERKAQEAQEAVKAIQGLFGR